jgi:hypothetical protein
LVAVCVLAAVGLVAVGLAYRPNTGGVVIAGPSSVVFGSDGIPTRIDGQRTYGGGEKAEWRNLSGSFLLGGYVTAFNILCPTEIQQPPAEAALLGRCGGLGLSPRPTVVGANSAEGDVWMAPIGSDALMGWIGGPPIVVRVHSHDTEAAFCTENDQAQCSAAIVVEAVVWPAVPTEIGGERVYRALDKNSFPTSGSFLLGGPFSKPDWIPACPASVGTLGADKQLIPSCSVRLIDALVVTGSSLDEPKYEIVVARVHIHDPLAGKCPTDVWDQCKAAIVADSVVWRSNPYATILPTPRPT